MTNSFDVVCCSLEDWDDVWRRNQFLVRELLDLEPTVRVLFVEPPHDVVHAFRRGERRPTATGLRQIDGMPRVAVLKPTKWLPRTFGLSADRLLASQVERAVRDLGFAQPILWINDAAYATLATRTSWPTLYDITDDWLVAAATPREHRRREARERALLARAEEVVVCSPGLLATRQRERPVRLITNAVDAAHYRAPTARPPDLPPDPVALYVGTLHRDRLDVELVVRAATKAPALQFVFVGPVALDEDDANALRAKSNIHLLGPRPWASVASYMQHAAVLTVPHVVTSFTESLDPLKAYEYLAAARPIVSTQVAGFRELALPQVKCVDGDGFAEALVDAVTRRGTFVAPELPSWRERGASFRDALLAARNPSRHRRLRVVYLDHSATLSGAELALARLLPALATDVDPTVVLAEDGPLQARLAEAGIATEVVALGRRTQALRRDRVRPGRVPLGAVWDTARYVTTLRRRLREIQPDLVHTNSLKAAIYGSLAGRLAGVPVVCHVHDRIAADYLPRSAVTALRLFLRAVPTTLITNSRATMATIGPAHVVAYVVQPPTTVQRPADDAPFCVGMVGRLAPWKGQHIFLQAFADAFANSEARARIVGDALFGEDAYVDEIRSLAARLGVADRVDFVGFVDDVYAELASMHVVVHASLIAEPFGQVVVEAMAAGVPVVATAAGGPLEIIEDGVTGVLVAPGDAAAMAGALTRLRDNAGLRQTIASNATHAAERYAPEVIAQQMRDVYAAVMSR